MGLGFLWLFWLWLCYDVGIFVCVEIGFECCGGMESSTSQAIGFPRHFDTKKASPAYYDLQPYPVYSAMRDRCHFPSFMGKWFSRRVCTSVYHTPIRYETGTVNFPQRLPTRSFYSLPRGPRRRRHQVIGRFRGCHVGLSASSGPGISKATAEREILRGARNECDFSRLSLFLLVFGGGPFLRLPNLSLQHLEPSSTKTSGGPKMPRPSWILMAHIKLHCTGLAVKVHERGHRTARFQGAYDEAYAVDTPHKECEYAVPLSPGDINIPRLNNRWNEMDLDVIRERLRNLYGIEWSFFKSHSEKKKMKRPMGWRRLRCSYCKLVDLREYLPMIFRPILVFECYEEP